jgi:hypothetical protein
VLGVGKERAYAQVFWRGCLWLRDVYGIGSEYLRYCSFNRPPFFSDVARVWVGMFQRHLMHGMGLHSVVIKRRHAKSHVCVGRHQLPGLDSGTSVDLSAPLPFKLADIGPPNPS